MSLRFKQPLLSLGLGLMGLCLVQAAQAQQGAEHSPSEPSSQAQAPAQVPVAVEPVNSVSVKTGAVHGFPTPPSFCVFSSCHTPSIRLEVSYQDAPELADKLRQDMLEKYFYAKEGVNEPSDHARATHHAFIKTTYLGSVDGYRQQLARNSAETAEREAKEKATAIVDLVTYIATRGAVQPKGSNVRARVISDKEVGSLPAGPTKILVTQFQFVTRFNGKDAFSQQEEVLTAAYDDTEDPAIRAINLAEGLRRVVNLVE